jgi:hypothetical protein
MDEPLLEVLTAVLDPARLRIAGLLAEREMSVAELAAALSLPSAAIAHHVGRLEGAALVETVARGGGPVAYRLRIERLNEVSRAARDQRRASEPAAAEWPGGDGEPLPADDAKVLRSFVEDGRLTSIPAQEKKRLVILRYLADTVVEPDRGYPEKELNQLLALRHPDVASLRRYLVDLGFMTRDAGVYRLRPRTEWPR